MADIVRNVFVLNEPTCSCSGQPARECGCEGCQDKTRETHNMGYGRDNVMQLSGGLVPDAQYVTANGVPLSRVYNSMKGPLRVTGAVASVTHEARHRLALQKAAKVRNAKAQGSLADVEGYGQKSGANHQDEYDASLRHLDADGLADLLDENTPANRWDQRRKGLDSTIRRGEPASKMQAYADETFDGQVDEEDYYEDLPDDNSTSPRRNSRGQSPVMRLSWNAELPDEDDDENWQEYCESEPDDPKCRDRERMTD
jgi:hypothetical protein